MDGTFQYTDLLLHRPPSTTITLMYYHVVLLQLWKTLYKLLYLNPTVFGLFHQTLDPQGLFLSL